jgi:hypothetical protein
MNIIKVKKKILILGLINGFNTIILFLFLCVIQTIKIGERERERKNYFLFKILYFTYQI